MLVAFRANVTWDVRLGKFKWRVPLKEARAAGQNLGSSGECGVLWTLDMKENPWARLLAYRVSYRLSNSAVALV
jgi:hypothetical protein